MTKTRTFPAIFPSVILGIALLIVRIVVLGEPRYLFLGGNLFLAWIPYAFAKLIAEKPSVQKNGALTIFLGILWLLFLPNTFYLLTDFAHLLYDPTVITDAQPNQLLWFDLVILASFVWAGMLYGFTSLRVFHNLIARKLSETKGRAFAVIVLFLSAVGVYLGRVPRFNSWDMLRDPASIAGYAASGISALPSRFPFLLFVIPFALLLVVVYFTVYGIRKSRKKGQRGL